MTTHVDGPQSIQNGKTIYMAKLITGAKDDETVIYLNDDPLDNRKQNLRVVKTALLGKQR